MVIDEAMIEKGVLAPSAMHQKCVDYPNEMI
jgi:hypothetical protein